jgi:hypothetical protein
MNGDKRKFLFVSITGLISDIAWQVAKEGHEVRYCIEDEKERDIGDGFVAKVRDWEREVYWADVIVFDDTLGQGEKAQALRAKGNVVVGGTPYTDRLEDDRSFGQEELKKEGINIVPYRDFDNFDDAIAYVKENPERYVIKPSGAAGNVKRRLFVGDEDDGQDVIRVLEAYKKSFPDEIRQFQLLLPNNCDLNATLICSEMLRFITNLATTSLGLRPRKFFTAPENRLLLVCLGHVAPFIKHADDHPVRARAGAVLRERDRAADCVGPCIPDWAVSQPIAD